MEDFEKEFILTGLEEMTDLFEELNELISSKQYKDIDKDDIDIIFRIVHSVKGNSKAANLDVLTNISHAFESTLISSRDGEEEYSEFLHSITCEYTDRVYECVEHLKKDLNYLPDFSSIEDLVAKYESGEHHVLATKYQEEKKEHPKDFDPNGHNLSRGFLDIDVLIIDDDPNIAEIVQLYLENGFKANITTAENGDEALKISSEKEFHIIICDYKMPVMDGNEFVKSTRHEINPNRRTPILFLSGYHPQIAPNEETWEDVFFVEKPIKEAKLLYYTRCGLELKEEKLYQSVV